MKMYLPFGDLWEDGHGKSIKRLIDAPSVDQVETAYAKICEKYGSDIFRQFAGEYESPYLTENAWNILIENGYTVEQFKQFDDNGMSDNENIRTWKDVFDFSQKDEDNEEDTPFVSLDFIIDCTIFLLNQFGAKITILDNDLPVVSWADPGYGCFQD